MRRSACLVLFLLLCSLSARTDATTVAPLTFEQLVKASAAVVYGRVSDVRSQWTSDRRFIESVVSVEILKDLKSSARPGAVDTVQFTVPGGTVGRYRNIIPGAPAFETGEQAVFFLKAHGARLPVMTGLTQGLYRVQRDVRSGELVVVPPIVETGRVVRGDARRKPAPMPAFEASVRAAASLP